MANKINKTSFCQKFIALIQLIINKIEELIIQVFIIRVINNLFQQQKQELNKNNHYSYEK